jgi:hypothetical protein
MLTRSGVKAVSADEVGRSLIGSHWNAVQNFLRTGSISELGRFDDVEAGGEVFETDSDAIEEWWRRGELDFVDIYVF